MLSRVLFTFNQFYFVQFEGHVARHYLTREVGAMGIVIEVDYAGNTHYICICLLVYGRYVSVIIYYCATATESLHFALVAIGVQTRLIGL